MVLRLDDVDDNQLKTDINKLVDEHKEAGPVIERLINFYRGKLEANGDSKRRKLTQPPQDDDDSLQQCTKIPDLSFQLPSRKKYTLVLTSSKVQLLNEKTQTVEHLMSNSDIVMVTCVPTPEKPAGSFTLALFSQQTSVEPLVFSLADKGSLVIRTMQDERTLTQPEDKKNALIDLLLTTYKVITSDQLAMPSRQYYVCSGVSPSTGKADTDRTFVKTYLRTKDGVLYFLPQGILFGFKKPTVFVPKTMIAATVITNVTKHTFDLSLQLMPTRYPLGAGTTSWAPFLQQDDETAGTILLPFSMIEQPDYAGIEGYIQKVDINDQSMTDATKAPEPTKSSAKDQYENEVEETPNDTEQDAQDDDQDEDVDFEPGENSDEDNPLEYDTDASLDEDDQHPHDSPSESMDDANDDDDGIDLLDEDDDE